MSNATLALNAGGLLPVKTKVDSDTTEVVVARSYQHAALGQRKVVRLASDRLGEAEDLAMEFLGFEKPAVSKPIAVQQIRSLSFAAWALINDPDNARFALDLVKQMKASARRAKSKPGHGWDEFSAMAKELGKSARHFLPPFWEEVGRSYLEFGNQTYAGRALSKSLEAERVHALESDRARRREVVLEFVLAGCLSGKALSQYSNDLMEQYSALEAYTIFRDLCTRRTRGGMAPWASMPKELIKVAKAAGLDGNQELENWLEEVIDAPAMGRTSTQFWKSCNAIVQRIVDRSPGFAISLLRHAKPKGSYWSDATIPWLQMLDAWGVFEFLWNDQQKNAPPLGEPIAEWFGRLIGVECPVNPLILDLLKNLAPRLKKEGQPLSIAFDQGYRSGPIDIDVLENCLALGILVDDPEEHNSISFDQWLMTNPDHEFRNSDPVHSIQDDRFKPLIYQAMPETLACRGGNKSRGWGMDDLQQRPFPEAAGERPAIKSIWKEYFAQVVGKLDGCGLAGFKAALMRFENTYWPEALEYFPSIKKQLEEIDPIDTLMFSIQCGIWEEYGWLEFEEAQAEHEISLSGNVDLSSRIHMVFPNVVINDGKKAIAFKPDEICEFEINLPKKAELSLACSVGNDLAIKYQDRNDYENYMVWASKPKTAIECEYHWGHGPHFGSCVTLDDGSLFFGNFALSPGDENSPSFDHYFHDGERFWTIRVEYDEEHELRESILCEIDPKSGTKLRDSVPAFFEEAHGGEIVYDNSILDVAPSTIKSSPIGMSNGLIGGKLIKKKDEGYIYERIDGKRWDKRLINTDGEDQMVVALLNQPGTDQLLPVTTPNTYRENTYWIWDPEGNTVVEAIQCFDDEEDHDAFYAASLFPVIYWNFLTLRDLASSQKLRKITKSETEKLHAVGMEQVNAEKPKRRSRSKQRKSEQEGNPGIKQIAESARTLLPNAPAQLVAGLTRVVLDACDATVKFNELRDSAIQISDSGSQKTNRQAFGEIDELISTWNFDDISYYDSEPVSPTSHLHAVAEFIKSEQQDADLPFTNVDWFSIFDSPALSSWKTMWTAYGNQLRNQGSWEPAWVGFLEQLANTGLLELPGDFSIMIAFPEDAKTNRWGGYDFEVESGLSYGIRQGNDVFIFIENHGYNNDPYRILRYSTTKNPGIPKGFKITSTKRMKRDWNSEQAIEFCQMIRSCTAPPLPQIEEFSQLADKLNSSVAEIALIWMGGLFIEDYQNNFLPAELRKSIGIKVADANAARQALINLNPSTLQKIMRAVTGAGPSAPFEDDRSPVFAAIEKTWAKQMPKRVPIDAVLQKKLASMSKHHYWQSVNHEAMLNAAANPEKSLALTARPHAIKYSKDRHSGTIDISAKEYRPDLLHSFGLLVGLIHNACPAHDSARDFLTSITSQVKKYLSDKNTLLPLKTIRCHRYTGSNDPDPIEWLESNIGKSKLDKHKVALVDKGLVFAGASKAAEQVLISFRPSKMKKEADVQLLVGLASIDSSEYFIDQLEMIDMSNLFRSKGFEQLCKKANAKPIPVDGWFQNPLMSASRVVQELAKAKKLDKEEAALYLQILSLPDPTTSNVKQWNNWKPAQFKKAADGLIRSNLVIEAKRARAGRPIFLPGEWLELKSPWLPIESWKASMMYDATMPMINAWPLGGPLVLRPYQDLFQAAWDRIKAGDEPRYEEVKRKRIKKSKAR